MNRLATAVFGTCARVARRRPWWVLLVTLVVTVAAGFAATRLTINTSTDDILSPDLAFRRIDRQYRAAFPREQVAIVVVDAGTAEEAASTATALADRLRARPTLFERVEVPGASPYFDRNALLFLGTDELRMVTGRLGQTVPALKILAEDPSLNGLARLTGLLQQALGAGVPPGDLMFLVQPLAEAAEGQAEGRAAALDWNKVFNPAGAGGDQGKRRLVLAKPVLDNTSLDVAGPALSALREEIAALAAARPGVVMRVTGDPALRQQELDDSFSGATSASALSFVLVALSLVLGIRSGRLIAALLITLVVGSIWTTGLAALAVGQLNLISVAFMVLFFGLGVDFGTHLGLRHLEEVGKGATFDEAITRAAIGEGPGITLSALCAAIGFLSFVPTSYVGLAEFGIISAWGMLVAVVVTFVTLPALMALMPPKPLKGRGVSFGLGAWTTRYARPILVVTALASVGAALLLPRARLDVNPLNLQNQATEPVQTYRDLAKSPGTSPYALNVLAPNLAAARELAPQLAAVEGVTEVRTVESFVPQDQDAKLAILADARRQLAPVLQATPERAPPPADREGAAGFDALRQGAAALAAAAPNGSDLAGTAGRLSSALDAFARRRGTEPAALAALDAALTGSLPDLVAGLRQRFAASEPVTIADLPPEVRRDWIASDGRVRLQVLPAGDVSDAESLEAFATRVQRVAPAASGVPVIVTDAGEAVLQAFAQAIAYTLIAIALVIAVVRRRLADVILVLAPLGLASLWTVAASAGLDLPFNFANVIVVPLLIGLGVASSVHIVVRAREVEEEGHGKAAPEAGAGEPAKILETSTPLAVLVAQLNTVAAFATLAISEHRGLYSMGMLLGIAILFVLIASLVVLPALLIVRQQRRQRRAAAAA